MKYSVILIALYCATTATAGPVQRHIERVFPRGGQAGTTVEVRIQGVALEAVREALFYRGGIEAVEFSSPTKIPTVGLMHGARIEQEITCRFRIAADCPLGVHPFRLRTDRELTTVSTFCVTPYPVVSETETSTGENDRPDQAMPIPHHSVTIEGVLRGDSDCFQIKRQAGERIGIEVNSVWLTEVAYGDAEHDLAVEVLDSRGTRLGRNDDSPLHVQDPILWLTAPADDTYTIRVFQSVPLRSEVPYLLHLSATDAEPPTSQFPAANAAALHSFEGVIAQPYEQDVHRIQVTKGTPLLVEVIARGAGSPLDPKIWLRHVDSQQIELERDDTSIADSRFYSASNSIQRKELLDPRVVWEPQQDGEYLLGVGDMRGLGGPDSFYRVEVSPVHDEINTYLFARVIDSMQCPRLTSIAVPQGNRWTVNFNLKPGLGNRYRGDLEVYATGLPPGVQMIASTIPAGQTTVPVQFVADPTVPPQTALIQVQVRPPGSEAGSFVSHCQESFPFLSHSGGRAWHHVVVDAYALAVTEPAPFTIQVTPPPIPLIRNGSLDLGVHIQRHGNFTGAVEFQPEWLPGGISGAPASTIPPGETSAVYTLTASSGAAIGNTQIALVATTTDGIESGYYTGVDRRRVSTPFFGIDVADPHVDLKSQPSALRRGARNRFVWQVSHRRPFSGTATVELLGLPKGVRTIGEPPTLVSGQEEVVFVLQADNDTLVGAYRELACEVSIQEGGQPIKQRLGKGMLRIDP